MRAAARFAPDDRDVTPFAAAKGVFVATGDERQQIEGLGFEPRALILWWALQTGEGVERGNRGGLGFSARGSRSAAVAWASDDQAAPTRTARWGEEAALVGLDDAAARAPALRAELSCFHPDGFALEWSVRPASAWTVHYLALGGDDLTGSRVGWLTTPVSPGRQRVAGVGLRPDVVLVAPTGLEHLATPTRGLSAGIGAAGARRRQAGVGFASRDGAEAGDVAGGQRGDAAVVAVSGRDEFAALATVASLDPDGLTIDWADVWATPRRIPYLALAGVRCMVGTDFSPSSPGAGRTRVGFRPQALLLFTWGLGASSQPTDIGRLSIGGASSPGASGCASWDDRDVEARPTSTHVCSSTGDVIVVTNTQTGGVHAAASLRSLDSDGFTLDWSRSDGLRRQFVYVALAAPGRPGLNEIVRRSGTRIASAVKRVRQRIAERQRSASSRGA